MVEITVANISSRRHKDDNALMFLLLPTLFDWRMMVVRCVLAEIKLYTRLQLHHKVDDVNSLVTFSLFDCEISRHFSSGFKL